MKSFKTFILESDSDIQKMKDKRALAQAMGMSVLGAWAIDDQNVGGPEVAMSIGLPGVQQHNDPRRAMEAEKNWNTDVGLAYDLSPEKELMGDPAGFKAVQDRRKAGRSLQFDNPSLSQMHSRFWRNFGIDR